MASIAHMAGESTGTGAAGLLEANGFRPTVARTFDTTSDTTFGGADGSLNGCPAACVSGAPSTADEMAATDSTAAVAVGGSAVDAEVAAALTTTVDSWVADVALTDPERFVRVLPAEFGASCESPCGASGVASSWATSDCTGFAEGAGAAGSSVGDPEVDCSAGDAAVGCSVGACAAGDAAASAEDVPVWVGVASADAVVSLLDGVEPVCAPPELCTTPESGSAVEA